MELQVPGTVAEGDDVSDVYALKQPGPDGSEWIQEHDSLEDAMRYQEHSGGVLVKRQPLAGKVGLWWVEVSGLIGKGAKDDWP